MSNTAGLPQDIIHDILLHLPVKSLAQCKCISKPWRNLISGPYFIKTYLKQDTHNHKLILISPPNSLYSIDLCKNPPHNIENEVAIKLKFEHPNRWLQVLGSCNGLLLVVYEGNTIFLLNPTTLEFKKLPDFRFSDVIPHRTVHGIGFDSSTDDYKIVTITFHDDKGELLNEPESYPVHKGPTNSNVWGGSDEPEMLVHVYTMKENYWERIQNSPFNHSDSWPCSGVFLNGSVHWLATIACSYKWVIAAFDIAKEIFWEVPVPDIYTDDQQGQIDTARLSVLGGCLSLCLYTYYDTDDGKQAYVWDLWVMKKHGVTESWTKISIKEPDYMFYTLRPICLLSNEEILMESDGKKLVVYDLKDCSFRDIVVCGLPDIFRDHVVCLESLVSPNCNSGIELTRK